MLKEILTSAALVVILAAPVAAQNACLKDQHDEWVDKQNEKNSCKGAAATSALCNANKNKACVDIKNLAIDCNYPQAGGKRLIDGVIAAHYCNMGCGTRVTGISAGSC